MSKKAKNIVDDFIDEKFQEEDDKVAGILQQLEASVEKKFSKKN